jgi:hypothetical protein
MPISVTRHGKRGGGPGRAIDYPARLVQFDIALRFDVSFSHAAKMLKQNSPEALISQERVAHLTKLGKSKDREICLLLMADAYRQRREESGFRS